MTKTVNGNILSDVKATPNSQSDMMSDQFQSLNRQNPTNRKNLPDIIHLGQDKKQKINQKVTLSFQTQRFLPEPTWHLSKRIRIENF